MRDYEAEAVALLVWAVNLWLRAGGKSGRVTGRTMQIIHDGRRWAIAFEMEP